MWKVSFLVNPQLKDLVTYVGAEVESEGPSMGSSLILFLFTPFFFAAKSSSTGSCFTDSLNQEDRREDRRSLSKHNMNLSKLILMFFFSQKSAL